MTEKTLIPLEEQVMEKILEGEDPSLRILREQLSVSAVAKRNMTGVGFFTHFDVPPGAPRLSEQPNLIISNSIQAEIQGLANGAGFVLWVTDGAIDQLEGYCCGEPWPEKISGFKLNQAGPTRITVQEKKPPTPAAATEKK